MAKQVKPLDEHCRYHAGHPWYYLLGGIIPTPKQIQADAIESGYCGYKADDLRKIDQQSEPKRSENLRKWQTKFRDDLKADLSCYREVVRELLRYRETQDFDAIPQTKVTAEEYLDVHEQKKQLMQERQELLDYQEKLDNARGRSNSDDFTKDELDGLDKELEADMPEAVKRQLPDYEPSQQADLQSSFEASAELSLSELPAKAAIPTFAPTTP